MKIFFDLLPVILFFVGFKLFDIFVATALAIGTTIAMIVYSKLMHGKVEKALMINGILISILGGITLVLQDKTYIMWKPTALYWIGALALFIAERFFSKNLIKQMMQKILNLPSPLWRRLNWAWIIFLTALGFLNLYIAFHFSENTWVNFKLFGVTGMMFAFMIGQTLMLKKYLIEPAGSEQTTNPDNKDT